MATPNKKAAIYTRVSTAQQRDDGGSLETQLNKCREWCSSNNHTVIEEYQDTYSGGTMERDNLKRLFADAKQEKFEVIIVTKIDRFSRNLRDFINTTEEMKKFGVVVFPIDQPQFSSDGPAGELTKNVLLSVGQFESDMIRERTAEGRQNKAHKGEWPGGPIPIGYDYIDRMLVVNQVEADLVKRVFAEHCDGRSYREILTQLNADGFRTKKGKLFKIGSITSILHNQVYIGIIKSGKITARGIHEPIIETATFNKVKVISEAHQSNAYIHKKMPNELIFTGLIKCGHCGSSMSPHHANRKGRKILYYRCITANKLGKEYCPVRSIASVDLDAVGVSLLRMLSVNQKLLESVLEKACNSNTESIESLNNKRDGIIRNRSEIKKKVDTLVTRLEDLTNANFAPIINRIESHQSSINSINESLSEINEAITKSHQPSEDYESLLNTYLSFWHLWRELSFEQRRRAVQIFVKEVRLYSEGEEGKDKKLRLEIDLVTNPSIETESETSDVKPINRRKYIRKASRKNMDSLVCDPVHYALLVFKELGNLSDSFFWAVGELWAHHGRVWAQGVTVLSNCNTMPVNYSSS